MNFCAPVWRFGSVVNPVGHTLSVAQADIFGENFEDKAELRRPYAKAYYNRIADLKLTVQAEFNGRLFELSMHPMSELPEIRQSYDIEDSRYIKLLYTLVPIVVFPRLVLETENGVWLIREAITVCAAEAKSKLWFHAHYMGTGKENAGFATDVPEEELVRLREEIGHVHDLFKNSLEEFYEDQMKDYLGKTDAEIFTLYGRSEIFGAMADIKGYDASSPSVFDQIEEIGTQAFVDKYSQDDDIDPSQKAVLDFINWSEHQLPTEFGNVDWKLEDAHLVNLADPRMDLHNSTALSIEKSGISGEIRCDWFGVLAPKSHFNVHGHESNVARAVSNWLAWEYGGAF